MGIPLVSSDVWVRPLFSRWSSQLLNLMLKEWGRLFGLLGAGREPGLGVGGGMLETLSASESSETPMAGGGPTEDSDK